MEISEPVRQATLSYLQRLQEEEDSYSPDRELDALISIFASGRDLTTPQYADTFMTYRSTK